MLRKMFCIIVLTLYNLILLSQSITTQYSDKKIEVGEQLVVQFEAKNIEIKEIKAPKSMGGLNFLGGPQRSTSTNMTIINGQMSRSQSTTFTYFFSGNKVGKYTLDKFTFIAANGQSFESSPIQIEVVKAGSKPKQQQPDPFDPFAGFFDPFDPFGGMGRAPQPGRNVPPQGTPQPGVYTDPSKINLKNDIFARIILDKSRVYVGEQVNASVKIYTAVNSTGFEAEKIPVFNGFWSQEIKLPEKLEMKREMIGGREFVSVEIKKLVLFPTQAGILEISPLNMKTIALVPIQVQRKQQPQRQPRDLFELLQMQMEAMMQGSFNPVEYKQIPYKFTSGTVKLEVLPLPQGAPKSFTGAVGSFKLNSFLNKISLKTDETIELKAEITGEGNFPMIQAPALAWNDDFESYDPTSTENIVPLPKMNGKKVWNYVAIPSMPGKYTSPLLEFTYFDPLQRKYITLKGEQSVLSISGMPSDKKKKGKEFGQKDLAKMRFEKPLKLSSSSFSISNSIFYSIWMLPFIIAVGMGFAPILFRRKEEEFLSDKKINDKLKKQLASAKKHLDMGDKNLFYGELTHCIWQYLSQKLRINTSELNRNNISEKLVARNASESSIKNIIELLDSSEMGLYTSTASENMNSLYQRSLDVLTAIEKELKS